MIREITLHTPARMDAATAKNIEVSLLQIDSIHYFLKKLPWKVKARSRNYILGPQELYECVGDVPNVTFPCAALTDAATGRIAIYYGCADTVTGLAFTTVDTLLDYMALLRFGGSLTEIGLINDDGIMSAKKTQAFRLPSACLSS